MCQHLFVNMLTEYLRKNNMKQDLASRAIKLSNLELRKHNSLLRKNYKRLVTCSTDNEKAQERMTEMENSVFLASDIQMLIDAIVIDGKRIFGIDYISFILSEDLQCMFTEAMPSNLREVSLGKSNLLFLKRANLTNFFPNCDEPLLRGNLSNATKEFFPEKFRNIKSEALVPIWHEGVINGAIGYGSRQPARFLEGYGSRFLKRLSRIVSLKMEIFASSLLRNNNGCGKSMEKNIGSGG